MSYKAVRADRAPGIAHLPVTREAYEGQAFLVELSGFIGGHSGADIIKGQENAIKVLGRLMFELQDQAGARIVSIEGGVADNVIPVTAKATFISPDGDKVKAICDEYRGIFKHEFKVDPDFTMNLSETAADAVPLDAVSTQKAIAYLCGTPNGISSGASISTAVILSASTVTLTLTGADSL